MQVTKTSIILMATAILLYHSVGFFWNEAKILLSIPEKNILAFFDQHDYDLIVVGAGTSGSMFVGQFLHQLHDTNRSCQPRILVIDSGFMPNGVHSLLSSVPLLVPLVAKTRVAQEFLSTSQKHAARGMKENRVMLVTGNGIGGGSMINALITHHGSPDQVDRWQLDSWTSREMNKLIGEDMQNGTFTRTGCGIFWSPVQVHPKLQPLQEAFDDLGQLFNQTSHDHAYSGWASEEGVFRPNVAVLNGTRSSSYGLCLKPHLNRVDLAYETSVQEIVFNPKAPGTVIGLRVKHRGVHKTLTITEKVPKVVLCSGSIGNPRILFRSGIGPSDELKRLRIPQRMELPVGRGFQDMPMIGIVGKTTRAATMTTWGVISPREFWTYFTKKEGALAQASSLTNIILLRTSRQRRDNSSPPNIEFALLAAGAAEQKLFKDASHMTDSNWEAFTGPINKTQSTFILITFLCTPQSRGSVTLNPENMKPLVDPNYFADKADVGQMVEGISWLHHIFNQSNLYVPEFPSFQVKFDQAMLARVRQHFARLGVELQLPEFPGCPRKPESIKLESSLEKWREFYHCLVRQQTFTGYHYMGGMAMSNDKPNSGGVLNPDLRVKGIDNLWVGDASVVPQVADGHPMTLISAIVKKLAKSMASMF